MSPPDVAVTTISDILAQLRSAATDERDKGDRFERLMVAYLGTDPLYVDRFTEVWRWTDWPDRNGKVDTGIDLVAEERSGGLCAIQCKFYDPTHTLQKADIDSFFTASGKHGFTSRMVISTTDHWSKHAEDALEGQQVPVSRLRVQDLDTSPVDWSKFRVDRPGVLVRRTRKELRPHQVHALDDVVAGLAVNDRGKLIMACGTGKTFTALKIAETLVPAGGSALFLVPSISLLSQSLKEWSAEAAVPLQLFAVCSDTKVGRRTESEDIGPYDLAFPATTKSEVLRAQLDVAAGDRPDRAVTVVFATYQSIGVVAGAHELGLLAFDLIICDEAHRTTGFTLADEDESSFVRIHDDSYIHGAKRLYMTATPRIYDDSSKAKAAESDVVLCSMDNPSLYGPELHHLSFGTAVGDGLLSDYKVLVLAVDEAAVSRTFQSQLASPDHELRLDDAARIIGCWNGLSKRGVDPRTFEVDPGSMRRAVAFSRSIKDSKRITSLFSEIVDSVSPDPESDEGTTALLRCEVEHVDGTFNALARNEKLDWLKADTPEPDTCRILSNARCLSEGVDVPALDAVLFLNPRNSIVDVVQSVGRVMRKAEGKRYGYVILPIGIPTDQSPEVALADNKRYKVVWQVLQALRAHDNRFDAMVNKLELNRDRGDQIQVIGVSGFDSPDRSSVSTAVPQRLALAHLEEWYDAIYAKVVQKVGSRRYWEDWAKDVAAIAERQVTRITTLLDDPESPAAKQFDAFIAGLRANLNDSITAEAAIEMLAQHLITKPVFDALFEDYAFAEHNPVSQVMQAMVDSLEGEQLGREVESLEAFYDSVRRRAQGIDNTEGRQRVITELYEKFFKTAFQKMSDSLGVVYTPIEVVDFIIRSVEAALKGEFGASLSDAGVHVLDPFTGTGTFIVRLLQSGVISPEALARKYAEELHANELILLAYYLAAVNIESAFHDIARGEYRPFDGIVLTDTFQLGEADPADDVYFPDNNARLRRQRQADITVVLGNPPYSVGQGSQNDNNQNLAYP